MRSILVRSLAAALKEPADEAFLDACVAAATKWRYEPARTQGEPVPVWSTFVCAFRRS